MYRKPIKEYPFLITRRLRLLVESIEERLAPTSTPTTLDGTVPSFHPLSLLFYDPDATFIHARLEQGRGLDHFPLTSNAHPFVYACNQISDETRAHQQVRQGLNDYYENTLNFTANEWLGTSIQNTHFQTEPSWTRVLPWQNQFPLNRKRHMQRVIFHECLKLHPNVEISNGWNFNGPISPTLLNFEAERLLNIRTSLMRFGFEFTNAREPIQANILYASPSNWCWSVTDGHHRAAVAAHLNYQKLPIKIKRIIRRTDVDIWPNVQRGLFSKPEALKIFDRMLEGRLPPIFASWRTFRHSSSA